MREILFRGKRIDNGKWILGHLLRYENGRARIIESHTDIFCYENDENTIVALAYEVAPKTVGQFTGLVDNNGNKIFEGDILSTENGTFSNTGMGHVLFYKGMWTSFYGQDALGRDCFDELHTVCSEREIIGNIHDNPELLNEERRTK